ncbi:Serine/threonine-protein kinase StkP [Luteitalea pratensis]|uniref:non-specific serine/threonine protein kinase n=1 Tax=Luteitalea pratensis TaxID=1855912 RepID=A0A143PP33_LUTPR|nr:protein kinase [Luteitalea pratensis]AMY09584.1 Serine/threonine-protein kinase StkP [Luteitalea pratensis]
MTPERWQVVKEVFDAALHCEEGRRAAFLEQACAADRSLLADVDALLGSDAQAADFLEAPLSLRASTLPGEEPRAARVGTTVDAYRILALLGRGGMSDVYLAEDTSLGRNVAIKFVAPALMNDATSRARFVREARMAAVLDHPNICTIYGVGEIEGTPYISMQYVSGETLQHVLTHGALSEQPLLAIAAQMADALRAAHAAGIVHRDIKPANIMVTPAGQAKVLDFGISRLLNSGNEAGAPTLTGHGALFGTPSYMAPEQARGEPVDARSDIFSFGTVLYEMATGQVPFERRSTAETMYAVINEPHPPAQSVNPLIPAALADILDRALAKDAAHRYQSFDEVLLALGHVSVTAPLVPAPEAPSGSSGARRRHSWVHWRGLGALVLAVMTVVLLVAAFNGWRPLTGDAVAIDSIAVLPFTHDSRPAELEVLAEGIGESVTGRLSQLPQLRVMARSTMATYRGSTVDPRDVGRALQVAGVVTGQVVQEADRMVVRLELVNVQDGSRLWGGEYSRPRAELFALPSDLAQAVSRELHVRLTGDQQYSLARTHTTNAVAYRHYLEGRYFWNKRTAEAVTRSIGHFQSAIDADPTFALAHAGLADAYLILRAYGVRSPEQTLPQAEAAAKQALKLDERLAEAHTSLGQLRTQRFEWQAADAAFTRAIALNPNYATAHHWQAMYLANVGRLDEAMTAIRRAQALDPLSLIVNTEVGRLLYFARQYDAAIAQYRKVLDMDPTFALAHLHLGTALVETGAYAKAIDEFRKAGATGGAMPRVGLVRAYALAGRREEAIAESRQLASDLKKGFAPPYAMAVMSLSLGDEDQALEWLERGFTSGGAWFLTVNPTFDRVHSHPRFQALLRRAGLPP